MRRTDLIPILSDAMLFRMKCGEHIATEELLIDIVVKHEKKLSFGQYWLMAATFIFGFFLGSIMVLALKSIPG